ncbi:BTB/POZ and MATH domain-containing protein 1 [Setaria viridis]|uniref:BTB/POZ and MATH domain-containing protein 1 n=1 Tax=Setaria viridis TaxID=4556 RepID=UPI001493B3AD|nr:BTB/POZ and MATH domain-containing protein 1-like [Setaria viridis]
MAELGTVAIGSGCLRYYPHAHEGHISLYLELDRSSAVDAADDVKFKFSLLDQSGNPVPKFTRATTKPCSFEGLSSHHGFRDFIRWKDLEESGCLKDDAFTIQCDVAFTTDLGGSTTNDAAAPATAAVPPPPPASNPHEHLITDILWKHKRGVDVTIDVGGEATFDAHGWLLAARSPVLEAELLAASSKEKKSAAGAAHRRIEIQGVDPKVFKAVLHYMYTDALPEIEEEEDAMAMAQGLLAAADRFKLDRLKLVCEETLSRRIDVSTAAGTLAVAEQHGCGALKAACLEFMARPRNLAAVMETEGYDKAKAVIASVVLTEVFLKQQAARMI